MFFTVLEGLGTTPPPPDRLVPPNLEIRGGAACVLIATGLGGMARWVATHHPDAIRAQEGVLTRSHRRLPHSPDVLASQCELRVLSTDPHTDAIPCLDRTQPREPHSGVGLDVLHDDDDLPARTLRHRIPDGQTVRRKMKTVRTWQRGYGGKRVGKCRD